MRSVAAGLATLIALSLLALPHFAAASPPQAELVERLQAEVDRTFAADAPGAAIIVVRDGRVLYRGAAGLANLELRTPMRPEMVFRIGSVTKQFTAVAILMLAQQQKLSLDDEIIRFLPDYPIEGHRITIKHLLTHTSGIRSYTDIPEFWQQQRKDLTPAELIAFFKDRPAEFAPGERWNYSNSGYAILGAIIEKASGQSYGDFVEQHIFAVLGMSHSSFDRTSRVIPDRVPGYKSNGHGFDNADYISMSLPYAAGSLLSTVDDLATWDAALDADRLVSRDALQRAWTSAQLNDGRPTNYGYGWGITTIEGLQTISHAGGINGFNCMTVRVPETRVFAAVLSNREGGDGQLARKLAVLASNAAWHDPVIVTVPTAILDELVGSYRNESGAEIRVERRANALAVALPRHGTVALSPVSATDFQVDADHLARISFQRRPDGTVASLHIHAGIGPDETALRIGRAATAPGH